MEDWLQDPSDRPACPCPAASWLGISGWRGRLGVWLFGRLRGGLRGGGGPLPFDGLGGVHTAPGVAPAALLFIAACSAEAQRWAATLNDNTEIDQPDVTRRGP